MKGVISTQKEEGTRRVYVCGCVPERESELLVIFIACSGDEDQDNDDGEDDDKSKNPLTNGKREKDGEKEREHEQGLKGYSERMVSYHTPPKTSRI